MVQEQMINKKKYYCKECKFECDSRFKINSHSIVENHRYGIRKDKSQIYRRSVPDF